jgi:Flp pilus assembly protein TadG
MRAFEMLEPRDLSQTKTMRGRRLDRVRGVKSGQAIVEFAIASLVFLLIVFGTIDLGRAMYLHSELTEATRDAVREARTKTANGNSCGAISTTTLQFRVRNMKDYDAGGGCNQGETARPGLQSATVTWSCSPSCTSGSTLTVTSSLPFQAITQTLLGISPITLRSTASVILE